MTEPPRRSRRSLSRPAPTLRNKLLAFAAALVLVPGILLVGIAERSSRESLQRVIGRQLAREAGHTAERFGSLLRSERQTLADFARQDLMREVRVADIDKRISAALATLCEGDPLRLAYLVVDPSRRVVASNDPALIGDLPAWVDASWLAEAERVEGPLLPSGAGGPRLVMSTPIPDPDETRRLLGTLVGVFDWQGMTSVTEVVRRDLVSQGSTADVLVSRSDGTVIGGSRSSSGDDPAVRSGIARAAQEVPASSPDYTVQAEAGLIVGRAALAPDLPDWSLLVVEPRADALAPVRRLSQQLVLTMGLALAAALALAALAAGRVARPLGELTRAIRGLVGGAGARRGVPVRSEDEVGMLASAFNQMAEDLDRAQRDLVEAEKFAFVGELASGVAHQIRTSLGVLGSSARILERSLPAGGDGSAGELAQMIREEVGRLGSVVDDLLTLGRTRPLRLEVAPVSPFVFRAADFVGPQAQAKGIRMVRTAVADEPEVCCEPELIHQVAVNLLVNAIQALSPGGCIEVRILDGKDGAGFEVWDDGPGVPEELRERVFQPFVTARPGGVGLGLTFAKRVVHDHRGQISLASGAGSGTCFRVVLPSGGTGP
jgi:signal transduction histidine kinase